MSVITYLYRALKGLPAYDSIELIRARRYQSSNNLYYANSGYDLFYKPTDPFTFGAITAKSDSSDLLSSAEIEEKAAQLYKSAQQ